MIQKISVESIRKTQWEQDYDHFSIIFFLLYIDRQKVLQICEVFISFDVNYYVFLIVFICYCGQWRRGVETLIV